MKILDAYDLTGSLRDAGELAGCSHHTVKHYVERRAAAGVLDKAAARPQLIDAYVDKVEEWVERSLGKVRADVAHEKLTALGYTGSERTTRRAVAKVKTDYRAGRVRVHRPWVTEPGMWLQYDYGDGPVVDGVKTVLFVAWLAWSRFRVVLPLRDKTMPSVFAALDQTFRRLGGVPTYVLTDNEKTVTVEHHVFVVLKGPTRGRPLTAAGLDQVLDGARTRAGLTHATCHELRHTCAGIGQHHRLTQGARSFAGTLGTRIYQTAARDPEAKGIVERANGFLETSFMPGREFDSPHDYNTQLTSWLPRANARVLRRTGQQPGVRVAADVAAMGALPPIAPSVGTTVRVRLGRDYYVRVAGNDYSVDPAVIGRFVDVHAGLDTVTITCAGTSVGVHQRCWSSHQTITDPAHVDTAAALRSAFQARTAAMRGPATRPANGVGAIVGVRALSDYDALFDLTSAITDEAAVAARASLEVVR